MSITKVSSHFYHIKGIIFVFLMLSLGCRLAKGFAVSSPGAGPVRVNEDTDLREFMRIDMGRWTKKTVESNGSRRKSIHSY